MNAQTLNAKGVLALLKETYTEWSKDNCMRLGAALAYYSVFSAAPLILIAIGMVGKIYGPEAAQGKVAEQLSSVVGPQVAQSVQQLVVSAGQSSNSATLTGVALLLLGASGVFTQLKESLNTIFEVKPKPNQGIWGFVRTRLLTFGVVLVIGFLMLASLILTTLITAFSHYIEQAFGIPPAVSGLLGIVVPFMVEVVLFSLMFKMLPDAKLPWKSVLVGAVATALLFEIGKALLSWYLGRSSTTSPFGAAGSIVLLLLWVYYTSMIVFFGAEFTEVYSRAMGQEIEPKANAMRVTPEERVEQGMEPDVVPHPSAAAAMAGRDPNTGAGSGARERRGPVRVEPSPLSEQQHAPDMPRKERLAPLIASGELDFEHEAPADELALLEANVQKEHRHWLQSAQQHPFAEVGAALGFGILMGLISRARERHVDDLSAQDHLRLGLKAAAIGGLAAFAKLGPQLRKRVNPKKVRRTAERTVERMREIGEQIPEKVESILK